MKSAQQFLLMMNKSNTTAPTPPRPPIATTDSVSFSSDNTNNVNEEVEVTRTSTSTNHRQQHQHGILVDHWQLPTLLPSPTALLQGLPNQQERFVLTQGARWTPLDVVIYSNGRSHHGNNGITNPQEGTNCMNDGLGEVLRIIDDVIATVGDGASSGRGDDSIRSAECRMTHVVAAPGRRGHHGASGGGDSHETHASS